MSDATFAASYQGERANRGGAVWMGAFGLLLLAAMLAGLGLGRLSIPLPTVAAILFQDIVPVTKDWSVLDERIVTLVRAPRILIAALSGAALAMCGAALQGIFRNPLVSPQILGISSGSAFGGALAILFGYSGFMLVGSAFAFGVLALLSVGFVARVDGRTETATIVLAGIIVGALFAALVSLVQFVADPNSSLPAIVGWLMGSFASATWPRLMLAAPAIAIAAIGLYLLRFRVNVLSLGDDEARSFGVRVERDRWIFFLLVALGTGAVVAVAGVVGWVGLVVPHAARLIVGPDHRILVPASALLGAAYLVIIDTLARTVSASEIPLSVLTAIIGAPVFALLLRRSRRQENAR
ncbi:MAG: iron ABC transporter permease [Rhizobiaceae bacterium]